MRKTLVALAVLVALPIVALAQKPVTRTDAVDVTARIEAIDKSTRLVTLKDAKGETESIYCGPEVKRFDELKVGDTVTFSYRESLAYKIRKPGQPGSAAPATDPKVTRTPGAKPGGTISQQDTATVTVKAVDLVVPSITVLTEDGRTVTFRVDDKKVLDGVKAGDRVEVTYTQALAVSVK
jgi:Cu/Ag efflux protein CusF